MNYALILAGGEGKRFWPMSRKSLPKQFLSLCSDKPMIAQAVSRISPVIDKKNIYIASNRIYGRQTRVSLKDSGIRSENVFFEPEVKNTLAPIAVFSKIIYELDPDAIIVVLPSDHYVSDRAKFSRAISHALEIAKKGFIVTLGIRPSRPETGYGYIKVGAGCRVQGAGKFFRVREFIEKPNLQKAKRLVKNRRFYWNSGIFVFRASILLLELKKFLPGAHEAVMRAKFAADYSKPWAGIPALSIDYAIMEKTAKTALLPLDCGWNDLGSWLALRELLSKDKFGNIFRAKSVDIGSKNAFVWSDSRVVATLGLKDIIVVDTKDALLVCSSSMAQEVKKIAHSLKLKNLGRFI